jgi:hypothetical protein
VVSKTLPGKRENEVVGLLDEIGREFFESGGEDTLFLRGHRDGREAYEYGGLDIVVLRMPDSALPSWRIYYKNVRHPNGLVNSHLVLGRDLDIGGGAKARYALGFADTRKRAESTEDFGFFCTVLSNIGARGVRTDFTADLKCRPSNTGSSNPQIGDFGIVCAKMVEKEYGMTPEEFLAIDFECYKQHVQRMGGQLEDVDTAHEYIMLYGNGFKQQLAERFCPHYSACEIRRCHAQQGSMPEPVAV